MNYIEKLWQDLFGTPENPQKVVLKQVLSRNEHEKNMFEQWKTSTERPELLGNIAQSYFLKPKNIPTFFDIHLLVSTGAEGSDLLNSKKMFTFAV